MASTQHEAQKRKPHCDLNASPISMRWLNRYPIQIQTILWSDGFQPRAKVGTAKSIIELIGLSRNYGLVETGWEEASDLRTVQLYPTVMSMRTPEYTQLTHMSLQM